ncbi:hypothetical protein BB561_004749 [Smittium simulii]|uniref:Uncharacterized protein n=1 Tax=Smittium simulii TaxID=133385 RepID=A0A2T9YEG5_9FUNG|nr:hypothetical protein BB561_004749 [Smittium simulii]
MFTIKSFSYCRPGFTKLCKPNSFLFTRNLSNEPKIKEVVVPNTPPHTAPYSKGIIAGGFVFVSGQLAINPKTNTLVDSDIKEQTRLSILSMKQVLEAAGSGLDKVVKTTVLLDDISEWPAMNEEYIKHFGKPAPARAAYEVSKLPFDAKVEIECIALAPKE